jgi:hypothetical protein
MHRREYIMSGDRVIDACAQDSKNPVVIKPVSDVLHVVVVVSNTRRYKRRYELFRHFVAHMTQFDGLKLHIVELVFGDRQPEIVPADEGKESSHLLLYTKDEWFQKEALINIGVSRLPRDWKYVAWIDADLIFLNRSWVPETLHMLQHHPVVQLFETAIDLGPTGRVMQVHFGFAYCLQKQGKMDHVGTYGSMYHPGYAWAMTREFWNQTGGLMDFAILGSADHHMCMSWVGKGLETVHNGVTDTYKRRVSAYQTWALGPAGTPVDVGFTNGTICHEYHGTKKNRKYCERWQILVDNRYDPDLHIAKDWQGLVELTNACPAKLKHDIGVYFKERFEDSVDDEHEPLKL